MSISTSQIESHALYSQQIPGRMAGLLKQVFIYLFIYLVFLLLGPHLKYMEVPRLGAESEL